MFFKGGPCINKILQKSQNKITDIGKAMRFGEEGACSWSNTEREVKQIMANKFKGGLHALL
jgi:hypothetical protein